MTVRIPKHRAPTHPGAILAHQFLDPLEMTQTRAAELLDVKLGRLNEIVVGRRGITPDTALRLERVFGMSAAAWLNLQLAWDLYRAQHGRAASQIQRLQRAEGVPELSEIDVVPVTRRRRAVA